MFCLKALVNNIGPAVAVLIYLLLNIAVFASAALPYIDDNVAVLLARGCGACLSLNNSLIILLVLRKLLSRMRTTRIGAYLPLDHSLTFHMTVGVAIVLLSLAHASAHITNFVHLARTTPPTLPEYLFGTHLGIGWVSGTACLTGWVLAGLLIIIATSSLHYIINGGRMKVFFWTHKLVTLWWVTLILHSPSAWMWLLGPLVLYFIGKILRSQFARHLLYGDMFIREMVLLPYDVTHLVVSRPENFRFRAGDYVYLNIPVLSSFEWHPFTISSAPEQTESHGSTFVQWAHGQSLRELLNGHPDQNDNNRKQKESFLNDDGDAVSMEEGQVHDDGRAMKRRESCVSMAQDFSHLTEPPAVIDVCREELFGVNGIKVYVDGPYGAPATHVLQAEHAVLIAAGIGVTPFASLLQSIIHRKLGKFSGHQWAKPRDTPTSPTTLRKVDFFWINRDPGAFLWFTSLLGQIESDQSGLQNNFIDMHLYMTSSQGAANGEPTAVWKDILSAYTENRRDLITRLEKRTILGRPDWIAVFKRLKEEEKDHGKVAVFFCGPKKLGSILRRHCIEYNFRFRQESC
ncbi:LOW QUALITY PROTEIN: NADPH oxidase 5-like [Branchiostoma floridae]|uniref:LOW QUALITY PROTEIN: NADPH oxidase 5-like n=1 Tax=Branchiostoma floridae TaxID=7739 RepID=A0A9J7KWE0_BRAFL|nr:LOW QUALITY PROTEIN: NADPH oxidase 5-like [Branchiostoma floridae]